MNRRSFWCWLLVFGIVLMLYHVTRKHRAPPQPAPAVEQHVKPAPRMAPQAVAKKPRPEIAYGTPTKNYVERHGYIRGYCGKYVVWVAEYLTANNLKGTVKRIGTFKADSEVPQEFGATNADYAHKKHPDDPEEQKGHCAPAADMHDSEEAMRDCFLLSNMMPQTLELNERTWAHLEKFVRDLTLTNDEVWVFTGPAWIPDEKGVVTFRVIGKHQVWVPTHCWKTALAKKGKQVKLYAWLIPNTKSPPSDFNDGLVSVDYLELVVGLDFWSGLPNTIEDKLER